MVSQKNKAKKKGQNIMALIKVTKENYKFNAMLIKLYVVDEYKNKYNYYYIFIYTILSLYSA